MHTVNAIIIQNDSSINSNHDTKYLWNFRIFVGTNSDYNFNSECPGSPFQSTQPTGNDAVGLEIWCNLDGDFVSIVRDFSSQVGTTYEVTLCDVAIFGPLSSSVIAVPSN